jgi:hypothetical protein
VLRVLCRSATCSTETKVSLGGGFFGSRFVCALFIDFHSEEAVEAVRPGQCRSGGGELVLNSIMELALAICLKGKIGEMDCRLIPTNNLPSSSCRHQTSANTTQILPHNSQNSARLPPLAKRDDLSNVPSRMISTTPSDIHRFRAQQPGFRRFVWPRSIFIAVPWRIDVWMQCE